MKKKEALEDLEIYVDPKPLTKEEELGLSAFIRKLKGEKARRSAGNKQNKRRKSTPI